MQARNEGALRSCNIVRGDSQTKNSTMCKKGDACKGLKVSDKIGGQGTLLSLRNKLKSWLYETVGRSTPLGVVFAIQRHRTGVHSNHLEADMWLWHL